MIIVEIVGGLGNQLFQYAAGRALSVRRGAELRLDVSHYSSRQRPAGLEQFSRSFKLPHFNVEAPVATDEQVRAVRDRFTGSRVTRAITTRIRNRLRRFSLGLFFERSTNFDPLLLNQPDNVYLRGYWQSERYFKEIEPIIRREFTPRDPALTEFATRYVRDLRRGDRPVVSVHVRRGDLTYSTEVLKDPGLIYGPPVPLEYVESAMSHFHSDSNFVVFSDTDRDLDWCRANIRGPDPRNLSFSQGHTDLEDFAIMRACDHHVISNSSFSWWAAWLNPRPSKRVIAPRNWFDPRRYPAHSMESLIPADWTLIG